MFYCSIVMQNIQILYRGPVMLIVTCTHPFPLHFNNILERVEEFFLEGGAWWERGDQLLEGGFRVFRDRTYKNYFTALVWLTRYSIKMPAFQFVINSLIYQNYEWFSRSFISHPFSWFWSVGLVYLLLYVPKYFSNGSYVYTFLI